MTDSLDEALMSKEALGFFNTLKGLGSAFGRGVRSPGAAKRTGIAFNEGAGLVAGGAAMSAIGAGAGKLIGAIKKKRDFREMMDTNKDLATYQEDNPKFFNSAYTSLRTMNPTFGSDPVVAGGMMRRMMDAPEGAGGILAASIKAPDAPKSSLDFNQSMGPMTYRRSF